MASATSSVFSHQPSPWPSQEIFARAAADPVFAHEIDHLLRSLSFTNVRLTLLAVAARGLSRGRLEGATRRALGSSVLVGILPEGSVGVLYVGPRPDGDSADREVVSDIARQIRAALTSRSATGGEEPLYLRVVHRWTDEIECAYDLIRMLPPIPARRTPAREPPGEPHRSSAAASGPRLWCLAGGVAVAWLTSAGLVAASPAARAAESSTIIGATAAATAVSVAPRGGSGMALASDVMRGMDASDKVHVADALARVSDGADVEWINGNSGIRYTVFLVKTEPLADGSVCRAFTVTASVGEAVRQVYRMSCRRPETKGTATPKAFDRPSPVTAEKGLLP